MIKRRAIGLAVATAVLGGLGAYGATAAFATTEPPAPKPTTAQSDSGDRADSESAKEDMVRHCTDQLPAGERAKARAQMEKMMSADMTSMMPKDMKSMMSGADGMPINSMMGSASQDAHHGMR
ncbi:hypothetical protein [Streptomyces halobius]|uniref:Pentapeptide MXKDX repeat protein n=1 Tax=Streptomyces halobius TaxID=2879846 RepID=A0ABY4M063_9ACTN|nr:hypothetical protein [Streptomyces halobius]UQA91145.1 hypothetical protein K9S39_03920 [Streptomyces halobius]